MISSAAQVSPEASVDASVSIWEYTKIREGAVIGEGTTIGIGAYVGPGVCIGKNCKIQNGALIYEPAEIADGVFIGPRVVFTNDHEPRATNLNGSPKTSADWNAVGVSVGLGASIGASVTCVAPVEIGAHSMVAAGAVVIRDVPSHALVAGVPAKQIGWVDFDGTRLEAKDDAFIGVVTGNLFRITTAGDISLESGIRA